MIYYFSKNYFDSDYISIIYVNATNLTPPQLFYLTLNSVNQVNFSLS